VNVDVQTRALLDLVEADRKRKCDAILTEAQGRRAAILRAAHLDARKRTREVFAEERQQRDVRTGAAHADLQTRLRVALQRHAALLLAAGWAGLPDELLRLWRAPDARRAWVAAVVASARKSLPGESWRVAHAPDWPAQECRAGSAAFPSAPRTECVFEADRGIRAGLKISERGCILDGTLDGLLGDRADIGARLLQMLDEDSST
jgi:hypothetical protein